MIARLIVRSPKTLLVFAISLLLSLCSFSRAILAEDGDSFCVRLFETYRPKSLDILPPFELMGGSGRSKITVACTAAVEKGRIWLRPRVKTNLRIREYAQSEVFAALNEMSFREVGNAGVGIVGNFSDPAHQSRRYHGIVSISCLSDGSMDVINHVSRRDYVTGVVASESSKEAPYEMLQAQAVLVQTILTRQKTSSAVIGDSTQSQSYLGCSLEREVVRQAVAAAWGENIYYKDSPINVYYHSTCAGGTSNGARFFHIKDKHLAYLAEVPCKNCSESPFWKPTVKEIPIASFAKVFGEGLPQISESDYTGRPLSVKLGNGTSMSGYDFWISLGQHFGWDKAPGTRFKLKLGDNGDIIVESTGAGHGVGFCQWGAVGLAKKGKLHKEILRYYFPGCVVH